MPRARILPEKRDAGDCIKDATEDGVLTEVVFRCKFGGFLSKTH